MCDPCHIFRYRVARGLDDTPANCGDYYGKEYQGCGIVLNDVVEMTHAARRNRNEIRRSPDTSEIERIDSAKKPAKMTCEGRPRPGSVVASIASQNFKLLVKADRCRSKRKSGAPCSNGATRFAMI